MWQLNFRERCLVPKIIGLTAVLEASQAFRDVHDHYRTGTFALFIMVSLFNSFYTNKLFVYDRFRPWQIAER